MAKVRCWRCGKVDKEEFMTWGRHEEGLLEDEWRDEYTCDECVEKWAKEYKLNNSAGPQSIEAYRFGQKSNYTGD